MQTVGVFLVGTSAGGHSALRALVSQLPADFPAAICVVLHMGHNAPGSLPAMLSEAGALRATHAEDAEAIQGSRIYVAPPDRHLIVCQHGILRLGSGPKENFFRPSVDPLFRSAARIYGAGCAGVVLTGGLDDGSAGLAAIKRCGGVAIVQDPDEAAAPSMPRSALRAVEVDDRLSLAAMGKHLISLARAPTPAAELCVMTESERVEIDIALGSPSPGSTPRQALGQPTLFTCPECAGVLMRMQDGRPARFRCHTGHAFTQRTLALAQHESTEASIWTAIKSCEEERATLMELAVDERLRGEATVADDLLRAAKRLEERSRKLREMVIGKAPTGRAGRERQ
ncbi:MAG: chemotaxis protein CheB [Hyphomicrobiaceae bacterium]